MILVYGKSGTQCVNQVLKEIFELYENNQAESILYMNSTSPDLLSFHFSNTFMNNDEGFLKKFQYEKLASIQEITSLVTNLQSGPSVVVIEDVSMLMKGSINSYLENNSDLVKLFRMLKQMELNYGTVAFLLNEPNRFLELNCTKIIDATSSTFKDRS